MTINAFEKICLVRKLQNISSTQKLILLVICSHLGDNDFAFLSLSTLQKECCIVTRHNVIDNLKILSQKGLLFKIPPSNGFKSNRYGLDFVVITSAVKEPVEDDLLVPQRNQSSAAKEPPQCRKGTSLVPQRNPKEIESNIKKYKTSASRNLSVDNFKSKDQKHEDWKRRREGAQHHIKDILTGLGGARARKQG